MERRTNDTDELADLVGKRLDESTDGDALRMRIAATSSGSLLTGDTEQLSAEAEARTRAYHLLQMIVRSQKPPGVRL
jgi:hypothetical protein